jgi:hypothetical protein
MALDTEIGRAILICRCGSVLNGAPPSDDSVNCSDRRGNPLMLLDVNTARRVGIVLESAIAAGDFDSAIPRFESWRPSQAAYRREKGCTIHTGIPT